MKRTLILTALALTVLAAAWTVWPRAVQAQRPERAQWIWFNEDNPGAATRYFRKVFAINRDVQEPVDEAVLDLTATDAFTVWVNGALVGKGDDPKRVKAFDVRKHLVHGRNVIA